MTDRPDRPRYYLTTSIAYANNRPGLHTLYEVIGADAIARWHRMRGDDTFFLTGTDEHSINIAQSALDEGRTPRAFADEKVDLFKSAEAALGISPDRFIRTTDPDHVRSAQEMVRRAHANGDIYLGTYQGWYCPNEGFRNPTDVVETARGTICPNHPGVPLQWLTERNWFFRLSTYQERLERHFEEYPDFVVQGLRAPICPHRDLNAVLFLDLFCQPFHGILKTQFIEDGRAEFEAQGPEVADGMLEELPVFSHGGDQAVAGRCPQGAHLGLGQGQALPPLILEIGD